MKVELEIDVESSFTRLYIASSQVWNPETSDEAFQELVTTYETLLSEELKTINNELNNSKKYINEFLKIYTEKIITQLPEYSKTESEYFCTCLIQEFVEACEMLKSRLENYGGITTDVISNLMTFNVKYFNRLVNTFNETDWLEDEKTKEFFESLLCNDIYPLEKVLKKGIYEIIDQFTEDENQDDDYVNVAATIKAFELINPKIDAVLKHSLTTKQNNELKPTVNEWNKLICLLKSLQDFINTGIELGNTHEQFEEFYCKKYKELNKLLKTTFEHE